MNGRRYFYLPQVRSTQETRDMLDDIAARLSTDFGTSFNLSDVIRMAIAEFIGRHAKPKTITNHDHITSAESETTEEA